jgi:hypothetical protein
LFGSMKQFWTFPQMKRKASTILHKNLWAQSPAVSSHVTCWVPYLL